MFSPYNYIKSFHVRTLSFGVFLALAFYYAVIAFHWQQLTGWIAKLSAPVLGYILLISFIAALKGGMALRIYSHQKSGVKLGERRGEWNLTVGDIQNSPKSDTLGQASAGMRMDHYLDFPA